MPATLNVKTEERIARELDRLKRRVVNADRAGADQWRQISFIYSAADNFGRRVFGCSLCHTEAVKSVGCRTGLCCRCRPDVFASEKAVLDLLPKRIDASGFCPFFNLAKRTCGVYGVRPFACRIYYNFAGSGRYCANPTDTTLQLFDGVKRHLENFLGPYLGGYQP